MKTRSEELWSRLFGTARMRSVLVRMAVDFSMANVVLIGAAALRLLVSGKISIDNPVGTLIGRVNSIYFIHAGWFACSALVLFAVSGVYKPVLSSQFRRRLWNVGHASAVGLLLHLIVGAIAPSRWLSTLEVAVPAWCLLCVAVAGTRFSRMYVGSRYRMIPRNGNGGGKIEDILVVGGAGYIGSMLTRQLLYAGYRVRILDLQLFGIDSLANVLSHPRLEVMRGDFRNIEDVVRSLHGVDAVVHLAAIVGDPACALDGETTIAVNYAAANLISQLAQANGISRFVFASTCSVYGASDDIRDEHSKLNPVSLYATTKIDAERALMEAADDVFQPTILRFATAYGWSHRPRFDLVANLLSAQAVTDGKIKIFNGEQWRPFIHARDIANACLMTLEAPLNKVGGQIFNVGDDTENYTLQQLGQIVAEAHPETTIEEIRNDEDLRNYRVSFNKIRHVLGFRARVTLKDGIQEIVNAVRSGQVVDWRDPVYSNLRHLEGAGLNVLKFERGESKDVDEMLVTRRFLEKAA